jgi:hypothetical protein
LIIIEYFSDIDLYAFILEGSKKNELGTCDSEDDKCWVLVTQKKEGHCIRDYVLFKEWLEKERIHGY